MARTKPVTKQQLDELIGTLKNLPTRDMLNNNAGLLGGSDDKTTAEQVERTMRVVMLAVRDLSDLAVHLNAAVSHKRTLEEIAKHMAEIKGQK